MPRLMLSLVIAVLLLGVGCLSAHAATFYVSTAGADSVTCAQAQEAQTPRRTINAGIACLAGGDTLIVKAGTYDELLADYAGAPHAAGVTRPIPGGTASHPTVIRGASPGTAIVTSSVENGSCGALVCLTGARYVVFKDLILDANWINEYVIGFGGSSSVPEHLRFENTEVRNSRGSGFSGKTNNSEFLNLDIHHNGWRNGATTCGPYVCHNPPGQMCPGYCHGAYMHGDNNLFDGGRVHDNDGYGLHLYTGGGGLVTNSTVRNVTAYNNHGGPGIAFIFGSNNRAYNNITHHNSGGGMMVSTSNTAFYNNTIFGEKWGIGIGQPGATLTNNIIYGSREADIYVHSTGGGTMRNNLLGGAGIQEDSPGLLTQINNLYGDPKFMNPPSDFHLQSGSPAIAAGVHPPDPAMLTDMDDVARPPTGAVDVGAYQYVSGEPTLPAPQKLRVKVQ